MKTFKNTAKISVTNARETENGTVSFAEPLAITDDSRQWNNTRYDISTLDITPYDGTVTADHGQKISDVIGKIINLRKEGNKVLIDGIKFAVNENPLAVLAKNLMKGGFVTGVSIETIGEDPDDTLTWKNHALCGLSVVAHPNNKNAYAVVSNSLEEAKQHGFSAEQMTELNAEANRVLNLQDKTDVVSNKLDKITKNTTKNLYFSDKKRYNDTMTNLHERTEQIINKLDGATINLTKSSGNGGGNPWHDDLGRFTTGPTTAIHATKTYSAGDCQPGSRNYANAAVSASNYMQINADRNVVLDGHVDTYGNPTMEEHYGSEAMLVPENFSSDMAATVLTVSERGYEINRDYQDPVGSRKQPDPTNKLLRDSVASAKKGELDNSQIAALQNVANAKTRAGSQMAKKASDARDILAINNTMKYFYQDAKSKGAIINREAITKGKEPLDKYNIYRGDYANPAKLGKPRYLKNGEIFTVTGSRENQTDFRVAGRDKLDNSIDNLKIGSVYSGSKDYEPDIRFETGFNSRARQIKANTTSVSAEQYAEAQRKVFDTYQKEFKMWMSANYE